MPALPAGDGTRVRSLVEGGVLAIEITAVRGNAATVDIVVLIGGQTSEMGGQTIHSSFVTPNSSLELDEQTGERDRYGRLLAHVWLADGTRHNEQLIAQGYAVHNDYGHSSEYKVRYSSVEVLA